MDLWRERRILIDCIEEMIDSVNSLEKSRNNVDLNNKMAVKFFPKLFDCDFKRITNCLSFHKKIVESDKQKYLFVGKTSNGKSAVLNSLLGETVIQSRKESTTGCFISIKGCKEKDKYILGDNGQPAEFELLLKANRTVANHFNADKILHVFYPEDKCPLLANKVELMDCPGLDTDVSHDELIAQNCEDADIFVLVLESNAGLTVAEQSFFEKVKEKLSKVKVIVLINKWDEMRSEKSDAMIKIKNETETFVKNFLRKISFPFTNSIYFVSAREADNDPGFQAFKEHLLQVSANGFWIKIGSHIESIYEEITSIINLSNPSSNIPKDIVNSEIDVFLETCFNAIDSKLTTEIKTMTPEMLTQLQRSVRQTSGDNRNVMVLIENQFPRKLAEIVAEESNDLRRKVEDFLMDHMSTNQIQSYLNNIGALNQIEQKYKNDMIENCLGLTKELLLSENKAEMKPKFTKMAKMFNDDQRKTREKQSTFNGEKIIIPTDIRNSEIQDFLETHFDETDTRLKQKIKEKTPEMLKELQMSVEAYRTIDQKTLRLFENEFPLELAKIFTEQNRNLLEKIEDFFLNHSKGLLGDESVRSCLSASNNINDVEQKYKDNIVVECLGLTKEMQDKLSENIELFWSKLYNFLMKPVYWLKNWETAHNIENKKILEIFQSFYSDKSENITKSVKAEMKTNLGRMVELFNTYLSQIREIESTFNEEKKNLHLIKARLQDLFPE